jgi:hypothetical protein
MNSSSQFQLVIVPLVLMAVYGGAYVFALVYYRMKKKASWISSLGMSFLWLFLYAIFATAISDIFTAFKAHQIIFSIILGLLVVVPYLAAFHLYFKSRRA